MKALSGRIRVLSGMPSTLLGICCTLAIASSVSAQEADNAMLKYGLSFLKTPYVAHTLEVNDEEKLVVNFDEVDCTTFVEYVLALSLYPQEQAARQWFRLDKEWRYHSHHHQYSGIGCCPSGACLL